MHRRTPCGRSWGVLCALGVLLVRMTAVAQEGEPARAHIKEALLHYENLEYEEALEALGRAQRRARTQEEAVSIFLYEGIILAEMKRDEEATASFEGALRLRPDAVLPLAVAPKIEERFEATREALKAQAQSEQHPAEPEPQIRPPVPLSPQPQEAPAADASRIAVTHEAPEPRPAEPEPVALRPQDESTPHEQAAEKGSSFSAPRLVPEMLGGAGGGIVGVATGTLVGFLISSLVCHSGDGDCVWATIVIGAPVGAGVGLSIGTYGTGRFLGGRGGYGPTFLGMVVGGTVGTGVALLSSSKVGLISIGVGALGGAAVGFELSHSSPGLPPGVRAQPNTALSVLPIMGVTPQGSFQAGLMGHF